MLQIPDNRSGPCRVDIGLQLHFGIWNWVLEYNAYNVMDCGI
jgi:hypothetical protein